MVVPCAALASPLTNDHAALQLDRSGGCGFLGACRHADHGSGGNAGKRLAAKTERADGVQVVNVRNLAGGVPLERERNLAGVYAASVVGDADHREPAVANLNLYGGRSGVDGVLDELLHDRRRTLDDLPCRYPRGNRRREYADRHGQPLQRAEAYLRSSRTRCRSTDPRLQAHAGWIIKSPTPRSTSWRSYQPSAPRPPRPPACASSAVPRRAGRACAPP